MARVLPIVVVLALLGCTAAAFAVTEGLKLEHSPVSNTHVGKVVAPDSLANATVPIGFRLRKPDRVNVEIVNGNGEVVRTLVRSRREPSGNLQFTWNGRADNREVVHGEIITRGQGGLATFPDYDVLTFGLFAEWKFVRQVKEQFCFIVGP